MRRLANLWNRVWFNPIPPYPLAAFRIAFGCYLLGYFLKYFFIVELSFSSSGVYSPYLIPDIAPAPFWASLIYGMTLLLIVAFILGFWTRTTTVLVLLLFEYHYCLNFAVSNTAYDRLNTVILVVLCFVDSGAAWSLDARKHGETRLVPAWQIRLLQFQLAALYFGSGLWKLLSPAWRTGEMVEFTLASPWASSSAFGFLHFDWPEWVFTSLTWGVVVFELVAGFTLYFRATRTATMCLGVMFHLSNALILMVPGFLNCLAMYALFFDFKRDERPATDRHPSDVTLPAKDARNVHGG